MLTLEPGLRVLEPGLVLAIGHRPVRCPEYLRQRLQQAREAAQAHAARSADLFKRAGLQ